MRAAVQVDSRTRTREGLAAIRIVRTGGEQLCRLDIEFQKLASLRNRNAMALDFLLIAASVYAMDKLIRRKDEADAWTRDISLTVPVSDPAVWNAAKADLVESLSFLSGDRWRVEFEQLETQIYRPPVRRRRRRRQVPPPSGDLVCLFSGGLDSLVGAIDLMEEREDETVLLVGHHDGQMAGPLSDQNALLGQLKPVYRGRVQPLLLRVGHTGRSRDINLRCRSILFIALGIYAAAAMGANVPLFIPENGTISLNVPLTPSRRGSCSTRTTHPHYLNTLGRVLEQVGLRNQILNPLEGKTKGEAVAQCLNLPLIRSSALHSVSCAKRGHKIHFTHREARACGRCMPCVYRRAALHTIGLDTELYGDDFCTGEVDLGDAGATGPNDLRACFSFLKRNPTQSEIERMLIVNGSLDVARLPAYADMVGRTMEEIRSLVRAKGVLDIRRQAGVA